jgi:hypothetical protein
MLKEKIVQTLFTKMEVGPGREKLIAKQAQRGKEEIRNVTTDTSHRH